jgi:hypothetical protein
MGGREGNGEVGKHEQREERWEGGRKVESNAKVQAYPEDEWIGQSKIGNSS